eukprot:gene32401-15150_t
MRMYIERGLWGDAARHDPTALPDTHLDVARELRQEGRYLRAERHYLLACPDGGDGGGWRAHGGGAATTAAVAALCTACAARLFLQHEAAAAAAAGPPCMMVDLRVAELPAARPLVTLRALSTPDSPAAEPADSPFSSSLGSVATLAASPHNPRSMYIRIAS